MKVYRLDNSTVSALDSGFCLLYRSLLTLLFSCSVVLDSVVTPWTVAHQVPLSMEFSRQEYSSGLQFPSPGDLPDPRIEPASPA